jgi:hypothetical protein
MNMKLAMAVSAHGNQVVANIVTQQAARVNVVDVESIGASAILASPAVPLQHIVTKLEVGIRVESKPWLSLPNRFHAVFSTCRRNSIFCWPGSNE